LDKRGHFKHPPLPVERLEAEGRGQIGLAGHGTAHRELVDGILEHAKGTNIWATETRKKSGNKNKYVEEFWK
jgi:hypothetical protein